MSDGHKIFFSDIIQDDKVSPGCVNKQNIYWLL